MSDVQLDKFRRLRLTEVLDLSDLCGMRAFGSHAKERSRKDRLQNFASSRLDVRFGPVTPAEPNHGRYPSVINAKLRARRAV